MFPFWEMVVAPLVKASKGQRVLEIGALRGETTAKMFDQLGPDSELHVIDPLPQFDPAEHERDFPGRYIFHRDLSLNVLPDLPAVDVALIDGDHNWYTVYNELRLLSATSRRASRPLPLLVLHDVGWPYGHRDLYYEPSQIPEEFRQPYRRAGVARGFIRTLETGGMNADLANAFEAGGPRNGVRRALDDFLDEHDRPVRLLDLPFYFGLAIVVEEDRLAETQAIGELMDHFESPRGKDRLLRLSEAIRLDEQTHVHNWNRNLERRAAEQTDRYLDLLKGALLDEHYLENEARIDYLAKLAPGSSVDHVALRDPARHMPFRYEPLLKARRAGRTIDGKVDVSFIPYTTISRTALDHLQEVVSNLDATVAGDIAECGVGRGGAGVFLTACQRAYGGIDRTTWVIDPFMASDVPRPDEEQVRALRLQADLNQVREAYQRFSVADDQVRFVQTPLDRSLAELPLPKVAVLRLGAAAGGRMGQVLEQLLPRVVPGGTVIVEGIGKPSVEAKLAELRSKLGVEDQLERVDWNTVAWRVGQRVAPAMTDDQVLPRRPMVLDDRSDDQIDLSVVVVFYNMAREAARTLQSLSRSYQRDIDGIDYEVLVVDNGSTTDQRLTAETVRAYGPEFRLLSLTAEARPSPTDALNRGISMARGRNLALMIDGAHVLTPGVLHHGLQALEVYDPAIVATQQWYVGPGQQGDAQQSGYDQEVEDGLFRKINWPTDGYRLFEIGHFIGDRDWFDGMVESNCLFVPRALLEQVGAFDDSFDMPGGGYANLDLFERVGSHPGVTAASILGEGSFHQFHGGTTTNVADDADRRRRVTSYGHHFEDLRGRRLFGLDRPVHFVGSLPTKAARRTRSRRDIGLDFGKAKDPVTSTITDRTVVSEELKLAAIEALWDNQGWRDATWMGLPVHRYPTDLQSYQELISQVHPDVVVIVGDDPGMAGRARFVATVCRGIDEGRVIAVGSADLSPVTDDPLIEVVSSPAEDPDAIDLVRASVGDGGAVVIMGLGPVDRQLACFEGYCTLVSVDSYFVVENTVLNGRPAASAFGPGPREAVVEILNHHPEFVADLAFERYTITFNRAGYLRRTAAP